jgi:hypothetical protein
MEMSTVALIGQFGWFAFGLWVGSIFAGIAEMVLRPRATTSRDLPLETLIILYVPLCLMLAAFFVGWIAFRSRKSHSPKVVIWSMPFALGLLFFPLLFALIELLIQATGQGQGSLIGSLIAAVFVGLLLAFAELVYRAKRQQIRSSEP